MSDAVGTLLEVLTFRWKLASVVYALSAGLVFLLSGRMPREISWQNRVSAASASPSYAQTLPAQVPAAADPDPDTPSATLREPDQSTPPFPIPAGDETNMRTAQRLRAAIQQLHVRVRKDMLERDLIIEQQQKAESTPLPVPAAAPPAVPESQPMRETAAEAAAREQVNADRVNLKELRDRYTELHPDVVAAREQLEQAEAVLANIVASRPRAEPVHHARPAPAIQTESMEQTAAAAETLARTRRELALALNEVERKIAGEQVELNMLEAPLADLAHLPAASAPARRPPASQPLVLPKSSVAANLASQAPYPQELSETATPQTPAVALPLGRRLLWSFALGLLFSAMSIFLAEKLDGSIKSAAGLQAALPAGVLFAGIVPRMKRS